MTVRELIEGSLRLLGVIADGENSSASEAATGLEALNLMIDSWSLENLTIFSRTRTVAPLVVNKQTQTVGPGGDIDTTRPVEINAIGILDSNGVEYPVEIINEQQWAAISLKNTGSSIPIQAFVNDSYPLKEVSLWPKPTAAMDLVLYDLKPLSRFDSINDEISLPPGYERALKYNLAIEVAPEFGRPIPDVIASRADIAKANIKRRNSKKVLAIPDTATALRRSRFNIYTGGFE